MESSCPANDASLESSPIAELRTMTVSGPSPRHASTIAAQTSSGMPSSENDAVPSAVTTTPLGTGTPSCSNRCSPEAFPPTRAAAHADSSGSTGAATSVVVIGLLLSRTMHAEAPRRKGTRRRPLNEAAAHAHSSPRFARQEVTPAGGGRGECADRQPHRGPLRLLNFFAGDPSSSHHRNRPTPAAFSVPDRTSLR